MNNAQKVNDSALYKIGYGLYIVTVKDEEKNNGLIINTVFQITDSPKRVAVAINKNNYSYEVIKKTGILNVNCLSEDAPFSVFERFGFKSGRDTDKFDGVKFTKSENALAVLSEYTNAFLSLKVEQFLELETHGLFICTVTEAEVINDKEAMTYAYYHKNVKPKPQPQKKKGYVCKICGYVYEGDTLPEDYICPLCKHPASDFEPIE